MQYICGLFGLVGGSALPNVFMFDSKDNVDLSDIGTTAKANVVARKARSVFGFNGYMNTVRGRKSNKYHFTPLRYNMSTSIPGDIVTTADASQICGNTSIAASQTYVAFAAAPSVYLTAGMQANATIQFPPIRIFDGNCPYGMSATATIGIRYMEESGALSTANAVVNSGIPPCASVDVSCSMAPTVAATLMQVPIGANVGGANGNPRLQLGVAYDGTMAQSQTGSDESIVLDRGFFYSPEWKSVVRIGTNEFDAVTTEPGARPKVRIRATKILGI